MKEFDELKAIIDKLRSPDGCPWDREQNHETLLPFLFEETNEVVDSIIENKLDSLKEELGDLLLQIMLHARIEEEKNNFSITDVIKELSEKLLRRHPHVFGNISLDNSEDVKKLWEKIKCEEKNSKEESIFDKIEKNLSPMLKSYKLQKEASKVGFDWKEYNEVIEKIYEELNELQEAIKLNNFKEIEHEIGDIFFALINLCRFLNVKPEVALAKANNRFIKRFQYIENEIKKRNKKISDFSLDELEKLWQEAKLKI